MDPEFLREINTIKPDEKEGKGDLVDALLMGIQSMVKKCGTRKFRKRVFLITDGERDTHLEEMQLGTVASLLK